MRTDARRRRRRRLIPEHLDDMTLRGLRASLGALKVVAVLRARGVPAPPVASRLGRRGVFIGASNSAGQGWAWARALEGVRPDLRAVSARFGGQQLEAGFSFEVDQPIYSHYAAHSATWQRGQFAALREYGAVLVESGDAVLARLFDGDPAAQVRALDTDGVRVALLFHGSDIRDPDTHSVAEPHSHFVADPKFAAVFREETSRNRRLIADLGVPVFVSTPDLLDEVPDAIWLPVVVDPDRWHPREAPLRNEGPPRVVHIPSNSMVKGTELVEPLLRGLDKEGAIAYRAVRGVPHGDMPQAYGSADVVIDQFRVGNYGVAACEAMAAGRIVVSHVSERVRSRTEELVGESLPIVEATPETLAEVLSDIRANPAPYLERAATGPEFVRRHHDGRRSGEVLAAWLDSG